MTDQAESFDEWRARTAPTPPPPWSARKRLAVAGAVLVVGLVLALPGERHPLGASLLVLDVAAAVAMGDDTFPRWVQLLILVPLGVLGIVFGEPDRSGWIGLAVIAGLAVGVEVVTRWRAKRH